MKIALLQTQPQTAVASALSALEQAANTAAAEGVDLLVTPEMFVGGYNIGAACIAEHAAKSADVLERLKEIATKEGIALVVGLALPGGAHPYNACVAISAAGQEMARYHKTHLYGQVDRAQFSAGTALSPVFDLGGWKLALAICYDVEFPEVTRVLALRGAELIVAPTANMDPFESVPTRLVPARAEENGLYFAYCNYIGVEQQFNYNGLSCICGPDGQSCVQGADAPVILYATLSRTALLQARQTQAYLSDRRPDLYGDIT